MDVLSILTLFFSFLISVLFISSYWRKHKKYQNLPPGPTPLPLLGNLNYVTRDGKHFRELSQKHGPVFTIWQLSEPIVVLCGYDVVKDALINHADQFSGRPYLAVVDFYSQGYSFPNVHGLRWSQLRRFTLTSLRNFGMGKTTMEERVLKEGQNLLQAVADTGGKPFNPLNLIGCAIGNIVSTMLLGEQFQYKDKKLQDLITTTRKHILNTHSRLHQFGNMFPILLNLPGLRQKIFREATEMTSFVKEYIQSHKKNLNINSPKDFIDFFLLKMKEEEPDADTNFSEKTLLWTIVALLAAGTETTTSTLKYCLTVMAHYPEVQEKVQQEIDEVTGSVRLPGIMDRAQMPYTNAVIHETQRLMDLAPIAHYHAVTQDTEFRGYTLPKGTRVIPFISSVLNDPTQWETPDDFNPNHFLDDKGQFRARPAFMVFSAGKRICAGENLARMELFLLFCSLMKQFTFSRVPETNPYKGKALRDNKWPLIWSSPLCAVPRNTSSK
ncbi:cytochrome P450 2B19 [Bombina bombina]|uniref:cytochrome P450 2B19 n=1 Tax=Bombina bombina TaxID=8345 RepID=UPI00235AB1CE|nr:cytochrome P450 2B19 [Bombina bombina]